jgi:hypothetical protein
MGRPDSPARFYSSTYKFFDSVLYKFRGRAQKEYFFRHELRFVCWDTTRVGRVQFFAIKIRLREKKLFRVSYKFFESVLYKFGARVQKEYFFTHQLRFVCWITTEVGMVQFFAIKIWLREKILFRVSYKFFDSVLYKFLDENLSAFKKICSYIIYYRKRKEDKMKSAFKQFCSYITS